MKTLLIWLALAFPVLAQSESVAKVLIPDGSSGSCVVIQKIKQSEGGWLGIAATAWHVVVNHKTGVPYEGLKTEYKNGRTASCYAILFDKESDTAIICVWIPDEIPVVEMADPTNDVTLHGYPFGQIGELRGKYLRTFGDSHFCDILVAPGFSGGGVFNSDQKLCGIISGGWFWIQNTDSGKTATWPTRSGTIANIREMLAKQEDPNLK